MIFGDYRYQKHFNLNYNRSKKFISFGLLCLQNMATENINMPFSTFIFFIFLDFFAQFCSKMFASNLSDIITSIYLDMLCLETTGMPGDLELLTLALVLLNLLRLVINNMVTLVWHLICFKHNF